MKKNLNVMQNNFLVLIKNKKDANLMHLFYFFVLIVLVQRFLLTNL